MDCAHDGNWCCRSFHETIQLQSLGSPYHKSECRVEKHSRDQTNENRCNANGSENEWRHLMSRRSRGMSFFRRLLAIGGLMRLSDSQLAMVLAASGSLLPTPSQMRRSDSVTRARFPRS